MLLYALLALLLLFYSTGERESAGGDEGKLMKATNEPMSDNMLDAINDLLHDGRGDIPDLWVSQLFDEACRARAREQALAAENAAMRPIVEARAFVAAHPATASESAGGDDEHTGRD